MGDCRLKENTCAISMQEVLKAFLKEKENGGQYWSVPLVKQCFKISFSKKIFKKKREKEKNVPGYVLLYPLCTTCPFSKKKQQRLVLHMQPTKYIFFLHYFCRSILKLSKNRIVTVV